MTEYFDIDSYLDSLPTTTIIIELRNKRLPYLPDLSRFTHLFNLTCVNCGLNEFPPIPQTIFQLNIINNNITSLPELPPNLEALVVADNNLMSLPDLPDSLIGLNCDGNNLVQLPKLPSRLHLLYCSHNRLSYLPPLPRHLGVLKCMNNNLGYIPILPERMDGFWIENFEENPVYDLFNWNIPMGYDWNMINIRKNVVTLNRFRELFYSLKFRNKFRDILWKKIREPKIQDKYHPDNLLLLLENNNVYTDNHLYDILESW
jgi:hypothetical protein